MTGWGMMPVAILLLCCLLTLTLGWRLSWLATRLDRAHARAERTWAALDAALIRRAHAAVQAAQDPRLDPASALLVLDAALQSLRDDLSQSGRERAESALGHILKVSHVPGVELEQHRAALARRLHNDAVVAARALRRRRGVRLFRLAGHAGEPAAFEIADLDLSAEGAAMAPAASAPRLLWAPALGESRGIG
ncbi:MAG TPA: hypothetical protein VFP89_04715 [Propionibacteriaceae bacterium]|nr:hypothetical protein [Propionibacteriaceae bacterium]